MAIGSRIAAMSSWMFIAVRRLPRRTSLAALLCLLGGAVAAAELAPPGLPEAQVPAPARVEPAVPPGAQPVPDDTVDHPIPPARVVNPEAQIQQVHSGRRVAEVIVVPAGTNLHYTLVNRD